MLDLLHVDDDALFGGQQVADFVAELRGVLEGEFAVAFDDGGVFYTVGGNAEGIEMRAGIGCVGQVCDS